MLQNAMSTSHETSYRFFFRDFTWFGRGSSFRTSVLSTPRLPQPKFIRKEVVYRFDVQYNKVLPCFRTCEHLQKMLMRLSTKKTTSISDIGTLFDKANIRELLYPNTPCDVTVHVHKSKLYRRDIVEPAQRVLGGFWENLRRTILAFRTSNVALNMILQHYRFRFTLAIYTNEDGESIESFPSRKLLFCVASHCRLATFRTSCRSLCGSGTIAIEAARIVSQYPTRLEQSEHWHFGKYLIIIPKNQMLLPRYQSVIIFLLRIKKQLPLTHATRML